MAFALIGALVLTLTVVPVLVKLWFTNGVQEKRNRVFDWVRDIYATWLTGASTIPR